jgi:hypothetical protein
LSVLNPAMRLNVVPSVAVAVTVAVLEPSEPRAKSIWGAFGVTPR